MQPAFITPVHSPFRRHRRNPLICRPRPTPIHLKSVPQIPRHNLLIKCTAPNSPNRNDDTVNDPNGDSTDESNPSTPRTIDEIRTLITSKGKAEQQRGLLFARKLPPASALEMLLLSLRTSDNDFIRSTAAVTIGEIDLASDEAVCTSAVSTLADLLATADDYSVRSAAAAGIGYVSGVDEATVSALMEALNRALLEDAEWQVHFSCLASLGNLRCARAVPVICRWLRNDNDLLVQAAVGALGDIADATAVSDMLQVLGSEDMMTRQRLAQALGRISQCADEPAAIDALRTLSNDQSFAVREAAVEALKELGCGEPAKVEEKSDDELLEIEVANLIEGNETGNAGDSASDALRRRLERSFDKEYVDLQKNKHLIGNSGTTSAAMWKQRESFEKSGVGGIAGENAKGHAGKNIVAGNNSADGEKEEGVDEGEENITDLDAFQNVVNDLKHGDETGQVLAAIQMRKFDPKLVIPFLLDSKSLDAKQASQRLRSVCVSLLARGSAVDKIIELLQEDPEQNVRSACCDALLDVGGGPKAVTACVRSFQTDKHWLVRISAAIALGTIGKGDDDVEDALIASLKPDGLNDLPSPQDAVVRRHAITALGFLGSRRALQAFEELLGQHNVEMAVRYRVAAALSGIPCAESVALARRLIDDESEDVSNMAQGSLDRLARQGFS